MMLRKLWNELSYRLNIVSVSGRAHSEHLYGVEFKRSTVIFDFQWTKLFLFLLSFDNTSRLGYLFMSFLYSYIHGFNKNNLRRCFINISIKLTSNQNGKIVNLWNIEPTLVTLSSFLFNTFFFSSEVRIEDIHLYINCKLLILHY